MNRRILSLGVAGLVSAIYVRPADACLFCNDLDLSAGDARGKAIAGLECQIDWEDKDARWGYTNIGQICNGGYDEILVHCPLMRTHMASKSGLSCASAAFTIQQSQFKACGPLDAGRWNCVLRSQDASGWYAWYIGSGPWSPNGQVVNTTNFWAGFPGANVWNAQWRAAINDSYPITSEKGGSYMLSCYIPGPGSCGGETCLSSLKWWER